MDRGVWRASVHGVAKVGHDWVTEHTHALILQENELEQEDVIKKEPIMPSEINER